MVKRGIVVLIFLFSLISIKSFSFDKFVYHTPFHRVMDYSTIYDIYTLNLTSDSHGNPITMVHMPKSSYQYQLFIENALHMSKRSYENLIKSRQTIGHSVYIKEAKHSHEVLDLVERIPTSIGYVDSFIYINTGNGNEIKVIDLSNISR